MAKASQEKIPWYLFIGAAVHQGLQRSYLVLGKKLYSYSWIFIVIGLVVGAALVPGQFVIDNEESAFNNLWVPTSAVALDHADYVSEVWPSNTRFQNIVFTSRDGGNVLTQENLLVIQSLHEAIEATTTEFDGENVSHTDICLLLSWNEFSECFTTGVLSYWGYDEQLIRDDNDVLATVSDPSPTVPLRGTPIDSVSILGQYKPPRVDNSGNYTSIPAVSLSYILIESPAAEEWELAFLATIESFDTGSMSVFPAASRSFGDGLSASISGDLSLVFGAIGLIIVYTCVFLGKFDKRLIKTRISLAAIGVCSALLGVYSAFGLCAWLNIIYGSPNQVLTFLILGIGVDDMFIIANEVSATNRNWSNKKRLSMGLSHAGASITLTSVTNVCAFAIGALSSLPAIQSFCIHAALAVFLDFFFQIFIFTAGLAVDMKRQSSGRMDCCCCVARPLKDNSKKKAIPESFGQKVIGNYYAPFLMKTVVKVIVLVVFAGWLGASIYGATQLQREYRQEDLIPSGTPYYDYIEKLDEYYSTVPTTINVYFQDLDYHLPSVQEEMLELHQKMVSDVNRLTPKTPWLESFLSYAEGNCNSTSSQAEFYGCFDQYRAGPGAFGSSNWVLDEFNVIQSSRFGYSVDQLDKSVRQVETMVQTRDVANSFSFEPKAFPYTFNFLFWEVFTVIIGEAVQNIASVLAVVFVVSLVFLIHPWAAVICTAVVAFILVDLLALMVVWDLNLDSVTVANLVMATGFAVDYSAHISHSFMVHRGTRDERAIGALHDMGISVLSGGVSTFLGIVLLAASSSGIFLAFFKMLFGTVGFGLLHGLILLPVILSLVGPSPLPDSVLNSLHEEDDEEGDSYGDYKEDDVESGGAVAGAGNGVALSGSGSGSVENKSKGESDALLLSSVSTSDDSSNSSYSSMGTSSATGSASGSVTSTVTSNSTTSSASSSYSSSSRSNSSSASVGGRRETPPRSPQSPSSSSSY